MDRSSASAPEHEPMIASAKHAAFAFSIFPSPPKLYFLFLIPCPQRDYNGSRCVDRIDPIANIGRKPLARQGKLGTPPLAQYNRANRQDSAAEDGASGRGEDAKPHHRLDGGRIRSKITGSGGNARGRKGDICSWQDRKSTRLNRSHSCAARMPSLAGKT